MREHGSIEDATARAGGRTAARPRCMVVVGHVEHGLTPALVRNLAAEIPSIDFTLADGGAVDSIWICGYEPRHVGLLAQLRARHPHAAIVVTRGGPLQAWAGEARRAGADVVSSWPLEFEELGQLLRVRGRLGEPGR